MTTTTMKPHVMIIYVQGEELHSVVAHPDGVTGWQYSRWSIKPESGLTALKREAMEAGAFVLDNRALAEAQTPGMSAAVPVIIAYKLPIWFAVKAFERLHRAILASPERGEGLGKRRLKR